MLRMIVGCPKCASKGWYYEKRMLIPICDRCKGQGKINKRVSRPSGRKVRLWHQEMQAKATAEFLRKRHMRKTVERSKVED
jgi:hypothetical protein